MSFSQALSGLSAQSENIKVISNNIANSQTVGYKGGRASFADIFAGAGSVGLGVRVAGITQDFTSGDLENTGRELDMAIAGQGFYRMEKVNGEVVYSRNGEFNQDDQGYLVNATGQRLTGFGLADADDPFSGVVPGGAPVPIQIPQDDIPPNPTTQVDAIFNLDASVEPGANLQTATVATAYDPAAPAPQDIEFDFSSSFTAYDSLGNERAITIYYRKDAANLWQADIAFDGVIEGFPAATTPAGAGTNSFTVNFDTDGSLVNVDGVADNTETTVTINATNDALGGAVNPFVFDLDIDGTTQFNNNSVQNTLDQDGYTSGTLIGLEVTDDGRVIRIFTNEQRRDAGQVVLTNFINPEGLQPDGDNGWRQTNASGEPVLGVAGTGVFGTIESQTLENSNVDLAQQLVDMIVSQRAYQANSSSIGTQDEMLQTVINL